MILYPRKEVKDDNLKQYLTCLNSSAVKNPLESLSKTSKALSKISASADGNLD